MRSSGGSYLRFGISWLEVAAILSLLWNLSVIVLCCFALALVFAGGCSRAVLIPESSPTRIGPGIEAKIYYLDVSGDWKLSDNKVLLPEGWYLVPPSYVDLEK